MVRILGEVETGALKGICIPMKTLASMLQVTGIAVRVDERIKV
jgi:hypothetical protein